MRPALPALPVLAAAACASLLLGCGSSPPPVAAPSADTQPAAASPSAAPSATEAPAPAAASPQKPLDLTSACPHDVHLYYGEHPGDGKGEPATVASGATIPVPRRPDGTQMVWVTDDKGFGLASVNITKHMRHIYINGACSKIDADSLR